jgi:hypothetical protein
MHEGFYYKDRRAGMICKHCSTAVPHPHLSKDKTPSALTKHLKKCTKKPNPELNPGNEGDRAIEEDAYVDGMVKNKTRKRRNIVVQPYTPEGWKEAQLQMMISNNLSFNYFDNEQTQVALRMSRPDGPPINAKNMKELLVEKAEKGRDELKKALTVCDSEISSSLDGWTSYHNRHSYLCKTPFVCVYSLFWFYFPVYIPIYIPIYIPLIIFFSHYF